MGGTSRTKFPLTFYVRLWLLYCGLIFYSRFPLNIRIREHILPYRIIKSYIFTFYSSLTYLFIFFSRKDLFCIESRVSYRRKPSPFLAGNSASALSDLRSPSYYKHACWGGYIYVMNSQVKGKGGGVSLSRETRHWSREVSFFVVAWIRAERRQDGNLATFHKLLMRWCAPFAFFF